MGKIFVSRQTAMLLVVICVLAIVCAGLIAALISKGACDTSKEKEAKEGEAKKEGEEGGNAEEAKGEKGEEEGNTEAGEAEGEEGEVQQGRSVTSSKNGKKKKEEEEHEEEEEEDEEDDDDDDDDDDDEEEEEERKRKARRRKGSTSTSTPSASSSSTSKEVTITATMTTTTTTTPAPKAWDSFRLPEHIWPKKYFLKLHPNLTTERFSGDVAIEVVVSSATDNIIVHAHNLTITNSSLQVTGGAQVPLASWFSHKKHQFWVIVTKRQLEPGNYTIRFNFNGSLAGSGIVGFYKSVYKNSISGKASSIATSKFEPTYARRAFPCFDEPHLKASYIISIVHQQGQIALSNMPPMVVNEREDDLLETKFPESIPMSTYLACFIVCDFENSTTTTQDSKPFSVYVTPGNLKSATYAREIGHKLQDFFAEYFDIPFPLLKQDLIAIPDFVSGAMEHWGLITFRETNLLYDPAESSSSNMQRVANVVSHELSHQWFGNLVTMKWWDDLWLNEGFATYMSYVGMDQLEPSWNSDELLLVNEMLGVMDLDSSYSSHPIVQPVHHPDEITEIFDTISYNKGASVIRMLAFFMGHEEFQQGIRNYLKKYAYANAKTDDLWHELSSVSTQNLSIPTIMDTWTKQMGYPIIHIKKKSGGEGNIFTAKQERFLFLSSSPDNSDYKESPYHYLWEVPLSYSTPSSDTNIVWLHKEQIIEFEVDVNATELVKFNTNFTGYYLVNYDSDTWKEFANLLQTNHTLLSRQDRVNLLYDVFSLAGGSHISYSLALDLTKYLSKEEDYVPWRTVIDVLMAMSSVLEATDIYPDFRDYVVDLVDPLVTKLGWNDTGDHLTRLLRVEILNMACHHGHAECLRGAHARLNEWVKSGRPIPPNLRSVAYAYGMQSTAGSKTWNHMWQAYLHAKAPQEKQKLLYGLSQTKETWLIHSLLDAAKNENYIRGQDYFSVLRYIGKNPIGRPIVWNFVRNEWEYLVKRFTLNDRYLGRLIPQLTSSFSTTFQQQEMVEFYRKYPEAGAGARAREQALERVKHNIAWLEHNKHAIKKWLISHKKEKNPQ